MVTTASKRFFEEDPVGQEEFKALEKEWEQVPVPAKKSVGRNKSRWVYSQKMGIPQRIVDYGVPS